MLSGRVFHWVMVLGTNDFWNWVVEQRRIFSVCFVTVPRTSLSASIRSRWSGDTLTCSWRTLYRKVRRLILLRSSRGSRYSWCSRAETLRCGRTSSRSIGPHVSTKLQSMRIWLHCKPFIQTVHQYMLFFWPTIRFLQLNDHFSSMFTTLRLRHQVQPKT